MSKFLAPSRSLLFSFSHSLRIDVTRKSSRPSISSLHCSSQLRPSQRCPNNVATSRITGDGRRAFSSSGTRLYKTVEEQRSRYRSGPFSWTAGLLFFTTGAGLIFYFRYEKARMERKRIAEATKGVGKPKIGGPFELIDQNGNPFSSEDLKGKYALIYFGFTHCPDICPDELDKMAQMIDLVEVAKPQFMRPLFITCDPQRDTPAVLKDYLEEFHPRLIGLTGKYEEIKAVCKAYRVYFSTPENVKLGQDYLVDHSIYFYLMDPEGDFVEAIGKQHSPDQGAKIITDHMGDFRGKIDRS